MNKLELELEEVVEVLKKGIIMPGSNEAIDNELKEVKKLTDDVEIMIIYMKETFDYDTQVRMIKVWEHLGIGDFNKENTLETLI